MNHVTGAEGTAEKTWFGQPRGLTILFLTNMWETFSYYGMRAILVYYMTKTLLLGQEHSSTIYGFYTSFAYFTPIIGGTIADRWLGKHRAVIIGASVMALGHFMMAFEPAFYFALATIALGNGLFLPTLPSQVNDLYKADDPRRPWAYNIYYVGVNVGAVLGILICSTLGETIGWHWGFGAAGIGMLAGLTIYLAGGKYLPPESRAPAPAAAIAPAPAARRHDWQTVQLLLGIALAVVVFRGAYEQVGNTVALWADSGVDRAFGGINIPAGLFQLLNPLLVIMMTPLLLIRWRRLADAGREHSPLQKMAIGALVVAVSYALLAVAAAMAGDVRAHWAWLVGFFLILTLGELYILPTGLGLFARLAPQRLGATTVASWFLANSAGSLVAGQVGRLWSHMSHAAFFAVLAVVATVAAGFLMLLDRPARRVVATRTAEENTAVAP